MPVRSGTGRYYVECLHDGQKLGAGRAFVLYGAPKRIQLPNDATPLSNTNIPGSGGYLVNLQNGQPYTFPAATLPELTADHAATGQWFRFKTLGDGLPGNYIKVGPGTSRSVDIYPQIVATATDTSISLTTDMTVGGSENRRGILELDLSKVKDMVQNPDNAIAAATLQLQYSATELDAPSFTSAAINDRAVIGGLLYFATSGRIWRTDGTVAGTVELKTPEGNSFVGASQLTAVAGQLYFAAVRQPLMSDLYRYAPTTSSPLTVVHAGLLVLTELTAVGSQLYYRAVSSTTGDVLYVINNSQTAPVAVTQTRAGTPVEVVGPSKLTAFGDKLAFVYDAQAAVGKELYVASGAVATIVRDIFTGSAGGIANSSDHRI